MPVVFPSEEWVAALAEQVNASEAYRKSGATWTHGPLALVVTAEPDKGVADDLAAWLDLDRGVCRAARRVSVEEAQQAPFVITAPYTRWKQVARRELDPIKGLLQGKLRLRGDLPTIVRFVDAAHDLVECSARIPDLVFADEV